MVLGVVVVVLEVVLVVLEVVLVVLEVTRPQCRGEYMKSACL